MLYAFKAASERHYEAAEVLDSNGKIADSAHLLGLAAECAIKSVLLGSGAITLNQDGGFPEKYKVHIEKLVSLLPAIGSGRKWPGYHAKIQSIGYFATWNADDRYKAESEIPMRHYPKWKEAATQARALLALASGEGCAL